jgi:hypothetical protein
MDRDSGSGSDRGLGYQLRSKTISAIVCTEARENDRHGALPQTPDQGASPLAGGAQSRPSCSPPAPQESPRAPQEGGKIEEK